MFGQESLRVEWLVATSKLPGSKNQLGHKVRCVEGNWTVLTKWSAIVATPIDSSAVAKLIVKCEGDQYQCNSYISFAEPETLQYEGSSSQLLGLRRLRDAIEL